MRREDGVEQGRLSQTGLAYGLRLNALVSISMNALDRDEQDRDHVEDHQSRVKQNDKNGIAIAKE